MKQKDYLWGLGVRDQAILDSLGKRQASVMIDQIKKQQSKSGCGMLFFGILLAVALTVYFGTD